MAAYNSRDEKQPASLYPMRSETRGSSGTGGLQALAAPGLAAVPSSDSPLSSPLSTSSSSSSSSSSIASRSRTGVVFVAKMPPDGSCLFHSLLHVSPKLVMSPPSGAPAAAASSGANEFDVARVRELRQLAVTVAEQLQLTPLMLGEASLLTYRNRILKYTEHGSYLEAELLAYVFLRYTRRGEHTSHYDVYAIRRPDGNIDQSFAVTDVDSYNAILQFHIQSTASTTAAAGASSSRSSSAQPNTSRPISALKHELDVTNDLLKKCNNPKSDRYRQLITHQRVYQTLIQELQAELNDKLGDIHPSAEWSQDTHDYGDDENDDVEPPSSAEMADSPQQADDVKGMNVARVSIVPRSIFSHPVPTGPENTDPNLILIDWFETTFKTGKSIDTGVVGPYRPSLDDAKLELSQTEPEQRRALAAKKAYLMSVRQDNTRVALQWRLLVPPDGAQLQAALFQSILFFLEQQQLFVAANEEAQPRARKRHHADTASVLIGAGSNPAQMSDDKRAESDDDDEDENAAPPTIAIEGVSTRLYRYQNKTVDWMRKREGVPRESVPGHLWTPFELVENKRTLYVNKATRLLSWNPDKTLELPRGGILAHAPGLGKTLIVLSLVWATRPVRGGRPTLVIVTRDIVRQWQSEARQHVPRLSVVNYDNPTTQISDRTDLVITSYDLLQSTAHTMHCCPLYATNWERIVIDEVQNVKTGTITQPGRRLAFKQATEIVKAVQKTFNSQPATWCVSGTPGENTNMKNYFEFMDPAGPWAVIFDKQETSTINEVLLHMKLCFDSGEVENDVVMPLLDLEDHRFQPSKSEKHLIEYEQVNPALVGLPTGLTTNFASPVYPRVVLMYSFQKLKASLRKLDLEAVTVLRQLAVAYKSVESYAAVEAVLNIASTVLSEGLYRTLHLLDRDAKVPLDATSPYVSHVSNIATESIIAYAVHTELMQLNDQLQRQDKKVAAAEAAESAVEKFTVVIDNKIALCKINIENTEKALNEFATAKDIEPDSSFKADLIEYQKNPSLGFFAGYYRATARVRLREQKLKEFRIRERDTNRLLALFKCIDVDLRLHQFLAANHTPLEASAWWNNILRKMKTIVLPWRRKLQTRAKEHNRSLADWESKEVLDYLRNVAELSDVDAKIARKRLVQLSIPATAISKLKSSIQQYNEEYKRAHASRMAIGSFDKLHTDYLNLENLETMKTAKIEQLKVVLAQSSLRLEGAAVSASFNKTDVVDAKYLRRALGSVWTQYSELHTRLVHVHQLFNEAGRTDRCCQCKTKHRDLKCELGLQWCNHLFCDNCYQAIRQKAKAKDEYNPTNTFCPIDHRKLSAPVGMLPQPLVKPKRHHGNMMSVFPQMFRIPSPGYSDEGFSTRVNDIVDQIRKRTSRVLVFSSHHKSVRLPVGAVRVLTTDLSRLLACIQNQLNVVDPSCVSRIWSNATTIERIAVFVGFQHSMDSGAGAGAAVGAAAAGGAGACAGDDKVAHALAKTELETDRPETTAATAASAAAPVDAPEDENGTVTPVHVIFMPLNARLSGLTLTQANEVILCEPPELDDHDAVRQAIGRTHRIGQKRAVTVRMYAMNGTRETELLDAYLKSATSGRVRTITTRPIRLNAGSAGTIIAEPISTPFASPVRPSWNSSSSSAAAAAAAVASPAVARSPSIHAAAAAAAAAVAVSVPENQKPKNKRKSH